LNLPAEIPASIAAIPGAGVFWRSRTKKGRSALQARILTMIWFAVLAWLMPYANCQQPDQNRDKEFDTLLHRAFNFHQDNSYDHALPLLRQAWKLEPHDYFVNLLLGIDLLRTGKGAEGIAFLNEAARENSRDETP
jgi:hypothetical protein